MPLRRFSWNQNNLSKFHSVLESAGAWTVSLVHGFFEQIQFSALGRVLTLTLVARRSRDYAGTRYTTNACTLHAHACIRMRCAVCTRKAGICSQAGARHAGRQAGTRQETIEPQELFFFTKKKKRVCV